MATYTGTPRTWVVGETLTAAKMNELRDALLAVTSPWSSYTPQIDQGATTNIAKTVHLAEFTQAGKLVHVNVLLEVTGAGTSTEPITVTLPVARSYYPSSFHALGAGMVVDDSASAVYPCTVVGLLNVALSTQFWSADGLMGEDTAVSFALASGDLLSFNLTYEAA